MQAEVAAKRSKAEDIAMKEFASQMSSLNVAHSPILQTLNKPTTSKQTTPKPMTPSQKTSKQITSKPTTSKMTSEPTNPKNDNS